MNKFKLFIENFIVYGVGGVISKFIPLIMLPIVTRIMPDTTYYGLSDLTNTLVQFATAFAVMGLYDAMYRMFFEKDNEEFKKRVCSTAFFFTLFMSIITCGLLIVLKKQISNLFFSEDQYVILVYFAAATTLVGATNTIVAAPTRMQNKRKIYLVTNTLSPLIAYGLSIPLLLKGYYVTALPLAALISVFTLEIIFWQLNKSWFSFKYFDKTLLKQLLIIGVPLLPNLLIYWLFNSCDKVMITNLIGVDASGVYSVASKLGHTSQLIYTAFAGGWQYFAFSTMKDSDQVGTNSKIFEYLGVISFGISSIVCACSYVIFKILFKEEYLSGYIAAPYLFLAPLLQMLFQVISNQFLIIKKTWPAMLILGSGAVINLVLNFMLIPKMGIEGAAIATLLGYVAALIFCMIVLKKMRLLFISKKFLISAMMLCIFFIIWRNYLVQNTMGALILSLVLIASYLCLYMKEVKGLIKNLKKLIKR